MKEFSKLIVNSSSSLFLQIIFGFVLLKVNSQSGGDSCNSNLALQNPLPFDTTSFHCLSVWDSYGYILRYMQTDKSVWSFVLSAPNKNAYVAMGFSGDGKMVGSSAIVGWVGNDGTPTMKRYFLGGQSPGEVKPNSGNLVLVSMNSSIVAENSRIYVAFQLSTDMPSNRLIYSLGPTGILPSANSQLIQHQDQISTSIDYASGQSETKTLYATLKRTHGLLNLFGWGIVVPIGIIAARYLRQWDPIWFYSHIAFQTVGFLLGFAGVICGLVLEDRLGSTNVNKHKGIGIFILVLGCLQVIAFLARPNKEAKVRKYWNWYHHNVGRILVLFAIANIFYGIHIADAGTAWNAGFAVAIVVLFITVAILEIRLWNAKD